MVFPIVDVEAKDYRKFIPGVSTEVSPMQQNVIFTQGALGFLQDTGSNKLCLRADLNEERRHFALCDLVRVDGDVLHVNIVSRCSLVTGMEVNSQGNYLCAKFKTVSDEPLEEEGKIRLFSVLKNVNIELNRQWNLVGLAGREQLFRRLENICQPLLRSPERLFMQISDNHQLDQFLATYNSFEKLSFLLCLIVIENDQTRDLMITSTDTVVRLEGVLVQLRLREFIVNIDGNARTNGQSLLRPNSTMSSCILFAIIIILMILKGLGYLRF